MAFWLRAQVAFNLVQLPTQVGNTRSLSVTTLTLRQGFGRGNSFVTATLKPDPPGRLKLLPLKQDGS